MAWIVPTAVPADLRDSSARVGVCDAPYPPTACRSGCKAKQ